MMDFNQQMEFNATLKDFVKGTSYPQKRFMRMPKNGQIVNRYIFRERRDSGEKQEQSKVFLNRESVLEERKPFAFAESVDFGGDQEINKKFFPKFLGSSKWNKQVFNPNAKSTKESKVSDQDIEYDQGERISEERVSLYEQEISESQKSESLQETGNYGVDEDILNRIKLKNKKENEKKIKREEMASIEEEEIFVEKDSSFEQVSQEQIKRIINLPNLYQNHLENRKNEENLEIKKILKKLNILEKEKFLCWEMCPREERKQRISVDTRDNLEMIRGNQGQKTQMIKKYKRSSADKDLNKPELIRKPFVLLETVKYLLNVVLKTEKIDFFQLHEFVQDRFRCIRQDFSIIYSYDSRFRLLKESILSYELMAEYNILAINKLRKKGKKFDEKLHKNSLNEIIKNLILNYQESMKFKKIEDKNGFFLLKNPNRSNFLMYDLLMSIFGSRAQYEQQLNQYITQFPEIMENPLFMKILRLQQELDSSETTMYFEMLRNENQQIQNILSIKYFLTRLRLLRRFQFESSGKKKYQRNYSKLLMITNKIEIENFDKFYLDLGQKDLIHGYFDEMGNSLVTNQISKVYLPFQEYIGDKNEESVKEPVEQPVKDTIQSKLEALKKRMKEKKNQKKLEISQPEKKEEQVPQKVEIKEEQISKLIDQVCNIQSKMQKFQMKKSYYKLIKTMQKMLILKNQKIKKKLQNFEEKKEKNLKIEILKNWKKISKKLKKFRKNQKIQFKNIQIRKQSRQDAKYFIRLTSDLVLFNKIVSTLEKMALRGINFEIFKICIIFKVNKLSMNYLLILLSKFFAIKSNDNKLQKEYHFTLKDHLINIQLIEINDLDKDLIEQKNLIYFFDLRAEYNKKYIESCFELIRDRMNQIYLKEIVGKFSVEEFLKFSFLKYQFLIMSFEEMISLKPDQNLNKSYRLELINDQVLEEILVSPVKSLMEGNQENLQFLDFFNSDKKFKFKKISEIFQEIEEFCDKILFGKSLEIDLIQDILTKKFLIEEFLTEIDKIYSGEDYQKISQLIFLEKFSGFQQIQKLINKLEKLNEKILIIDLNQSQINLNDQLDDLKQKMSYIMFQDFQILKKNSQNFLIFPESENFKNFLNFAKISQKFSKYHQKKFKIKNQENKIDIYHFEKPQYFDFERINTVLPVKKFKNEIYYDVQLLEKIKNF